MGEERKKIIPMEIYKGKGEIIRDKQQVLIKCGKLTSKSFKTHCNLWYRIL